VVWRGEDGPPEPEALANRVVADARRVGVLAACDVLGASVQVVAPAYARFERGVEEVVNSALAWLRERNVHPLGRYGRWEYSSMQHAVTDGLALGRALRGAA
jgi:protoporphyrinogen oxidase